jgi:hypothetical protein
MKPKVQKLSILLTIMMLGMGCLLFTDNKAFAQQSEQNDQVENEINDTSPQGIQTPNSGAQSQTAEEIEEQATENESTVQEEDDQEERYLEPSDRLLLEELQNEEGKEVFLDLSRDRGAYFASSDLFPDAEKEEYDFIKEGPIRRFEIIFFISLPFAFMYNEMIIESFVRSMYKIYDPRHAIVTNFMWVYIIVSSIVIAAGIAYEDFLYTFGEKSDQDMWYDPEEAMISPQDEIQVNMNFLYVRF